MRSKEQLPKSADELSHDENNCFQVLWLHDEQEAVPK
jgi:hypothetical protein